ncbi:MAG: hypothetical protein B7733_09755 [Myxococcales bacterium FL481]|nr:MAG: hypothetical protein B7733_09755 [Myxococcales bacterium FL481]
MGRLRGNPALCQTCHADADCVQCHNGDVRPLRIHQADYITAHALDARARALDCQAGHRLQSDCRACHERLRVISGPRGSFGVGSPLRFHPQGWAGPPGSVARQGHAVAAQQNLAACVSCHEEQTCMSCHATATGPGAGLGVNPHGAAFAGSARCQALASRSRRVCLRCHAPGDPMLSCLR